MHSTDPARVAERDEVLRARGKAGRARQLGATPPATDHEPSSAPGPRARYDAATARAAAWPAGYVEAVAEVAALEFLTCAPMDRLRAMVAERVDAQAERPVLAARAGVQLSEAPPSSTVEELTGEWIEAVATAVDALAGKAVDPALAAIVAAARERVAEFSKHRPRADAGDRT